MWLILLLRRFLRAKKGYWFNLCSILVYREAKLKTLYHRGLMISCSILVFEIANLLQYSHEICNFLTHLTLFSFGLNLSHYCISLPILDNASILLFCFFLFNWLVEPMHSLIFLEIIVDLQNPYSVNILLAGYDKETGPALYFVDYIATLHKVDKAAFGYGAYFSLAMMDRHYRSNMSLDEAIKLVDECIEEIRTRLVVAPPNFVIKIVDKDGAREYAWRETIKDKSYVSADVSAASAEVLTS